MSQPFGGHPKFGNYLNWARDHEGCTINTGYEIDEDGETHTITRIVAPSGRWVIEVGTKQEEYLVPSRVAYLDRRLALKSPWFSIDPETGEVKPGTEDGPKAVQ